MNRGALHKPAVRGVGAGAGLSKWGALAPSQAETLGWAQEVVGFTGGVLFLPLTLAPPVDLISCQSRKV